MIIVAALDGQFQTPLLIQMYQVFYRLASGSLYVLQDWNDVLCFFDSPLLVWISLSLP